MTQFYFENTKTGRKFKIVAFDKEAGTVTLKGEFAQFIEPYDKEKFKSTGYVLKKEE